MAVPARRERLRGAQAASELARAGTIEVRASDGLSCDWLTFGHQPHHQRAALYTHWRNCQRFFVTNSTKIWETPFIGFPLNLTIDLGKHTGNFFKKIRLALESE
jgi:hypothetical protein